MTEPALSHPPRAGSDPELFPQRENTMPKAASKLAAAPSAPIARRTSNTPVAVHSSSIPTTSLPHESTEAMRTGLNQQNSEVGIISFKIEVSHSSQHSRAAILYGLVRCRMALSMDELTTSASITGDPIPDFENLDFKIASGLGKIPCRKLQETSQRSRR